MKSHILVFVCGLALGAYGMRLLANMYAQAVVSGIERSL
jgi:hypothetical protein